jgi:hypothetical protein
MRAPNLAISIFLFDRSGEKADTALRRRRKNPLPLSIYLIDRMTLRRNVDRGQKSARHSAFHFDASPIVRGGVVKFLHRECHANAAVHVPPRREKRRREENRGRVREDTRRVGNFRA